MEESAGICSCSVSIGIVLNGIHSCSIQKLINGLKNGRHENVKLQLVVFVEY